MNILIFELIGLFSRLFTLTVWKLNIFLKRLKNLLKKETCKQIYLVIYIFRTHSKLRGYFCTGFIDFILSGKSLIHYTSFFSFYNFEENGNIIFSYFKNEWTN